MKNIDTIRSLTAEELSKLLEALMVNNDCIKDCPAFKFCNDNIPPNKPCYEILYDWLISDVEVN